MTTTNTTKDPRLTLLLNWIPTLTEYALKPHTLRPASADASFRRYFRIEGAWDKSYILMDAPPPQEDVKPFIDVANMLDRASVTVPQIYASQVEQGFLLLSDLGQVRYSDLLTKTADPKTVKKLYQDAIESLVKIQLHSQPGILPEFDRTAQLREMMLFPEWYISKHLGVTLSSTQQAGLNKVFEAILANTTTHAQVFVHRDYHSRNLMVINDMTGCKTNPGILDFQGAVFGPITYDIASLLRDAYIEMEEEQMLDWTIRYWECARRAGLPIAEIDQFYRDVEYMGLQRHLKILGIFCRLSYRDGKDNYLADLPLVLSYVRKTVQRYSALKPLAKLLDELENTNPQVGYTF